MHFPDVKLHEAANSKYLADMFQSKRSGRSVDSNFPGLKPGRCFCNIRLSHSSSGRPTIVDEHLSGLTTVASRLSYLLLAGPWDNAMVLHRCGYSACLNPSHLYLGTAKQNRRDHVFHTGVRDSMESSQLPVPANTFPELREKQVQHLWPRPIEFSKEQPLADSGFEGIDSRQCLTAYWVPKSPNHLRRFMWKLFIGPIYDKQDPSLNVINSCWNPYCINPYHLKLYVPEGSLASVEMW